MGSALEDFLTQHPELGKMQTEPTAIFTRYATLPPSGAHALADEFDRLCRSRAGRVVTGSDDEKVFASGAVYAQWLIRQGAVSGEATSSTHRSCFTKDSWFALTMVVAWNPKTNRTTGNYAAAWLSADELEYRSQRGKQYSGTALR